MAPPRIPGARRRGFTMVELVLAAMVTSLVAAASATFISAACNATLGTQNMRTDQVTGHFVLTQFTRALRGARTLGQVQPTSMTLWLDDTNNNDKMNLYETGVIRYDSATGNILLDRMQTANGSIPASTITVAQFQDVNQLRALYTGQDYKSVVWASGVPNTFAFTAYPNPLETRIVGLYFEVGSINPKTAFNASIRGAASGDYLFFSQTQRKPLPGSARIARKYYPLYNGYSGYSGFSGYTDIGAISGVSSL